jgi:hypothetical protein
MRYRVTATLINEDDWTIDLTVQFLTDLNVLIKTKTISIDADKYDQQGILLRLNGELDREIRQAQTFPFTQAQADEIALDMTNRKPG